MRRLILTLIIVASGVCAAAIGIPKFLTTANAGCSQNC
jgi:hypothetical protein